MAVFYKYQGAGNDFVLVDNRMNTMKFDTGQVKSICDRRFGIGADGFMLLENEEGYDFRMVYFNSDGRESTMCGNGGRCISEFYRHLAGNIPESVKFIAVDGEHEAFFPEQGIVKLKMQNVNGLQKKEDHYFLNTGSPHVVKFYDNVDALNVYEEGKKIRYSEEYIKEGVNVNFVSVENEDIKLRTYERGVEDETLACGTGAVASAIAASIYSDKIKNPVNVQAAGGKLNVEFEEKADEYFNVWLTGPAKFVYKATLNPELLK